MFTGIVEEIGKIASVNAVDKGYTLTISGGKVLEGTQLGDSIAVNGVCLTVTHLSGKTFTVGVAPETRSRTNIEALRAGSPVNLERAVTPTTRLGGHYVQGHVDAAGTVTQIRPDKESLWFTIQAPAVVMRYVVPKGFICLDGASLTVVDVNPESFTVMLVAYTQDHVIMAKQQPGYKVNIEVDILGKYVEKLVAGYLPANSGVSLQTLLENGFKPT